MVLLWKLWNSNWSSQNLKMSPKNYLVKLFFYGNFNSNIDFLFKNQHSQITKYQNMKICWIRGSLRKSPNFLHLVFFLSQHQCWAGTRSGGLKTSVGCFFETASVFCWLSDRLYKYITSGSHFLKPLPSELKWKIIIFLVPAPGTHLETSFKVKEPGKEPRKNCRVFHENL